MGEGADITLCIRHDIMQLSHKQDPPMRWVGLRVITRLPAKDVNAFINQALDEYESNLFAVNSGHPRHEQYKFPEGPMVELVSLAAENGQSFKVFPDGIKTIFESLKQLDDEIDDPHRFIPPQFIFIDNELGKADTTNRKTWKYHDVVREMGLYESYQDTYPDATIRCVQANLFPGARDFLEKNIHNTLSELLDIDRLELQYAAGEDWETVAAMDVDELVQLFIRVFGPDAADGQLEQQVRALYERYWAEIKAKPQASRHDSNAYSYINYFLRNIFDYAIMIERDWAADNSELHKADSGK